MISRSRKQYNHRVCTVLFVLSLLVCPAAVGQQTYFWDNGAPDPFFNSAQNWSSNILPGANDIASFSQDASAIFNGVHTINRLRIGYSADSDTQLIMNGLILTVQEDARIGYHRFNVFSGHEYHAGELTFVNGLMNVGDDLILGVEGSEADGNGVGMGTLTMSNGTINVSDAMLLSDDVNSFGGGGKVVLMGNSNLNTDRTFINGTLFPGPAVEVNSTSTWQNTGHILVNEGGIKVNSFGTLESGSITLNGNNPTLSSQIGSLTIDGGTVDGGALAVNGGAVSISNGGSLTSTTTQIAEQDHALGHSDVGKITVAGTNSTFTNSGNVEVGGYTASAVGLSGVGTGILNVQDDGFVSAGFLVVGPDDDIGELNIDSGGVVSNTAAYLGNLADSIGTVTVTGADSQWNNSGQVRVGNFGTGELNVAAGGVVSSSSSMTTIIGTKSESMGTVTVTGSDSLWENSSQLRVGDQGTAVLNVEAGGVVSGTNVFIGTSSGSMGTAAVTGSGSQWNNTGNLLIGRVGTGILNVEDGGCVSNADAVVGQLSGGMGTVTVTGTGSQWKNAGSLVVGTNSTGEMTIEAGGVVTNTEGTIGDVSTGTATVTGPGSQWNNSSDLIVGSNGTGVLIVQEEGVVSNTTVSIGLGSGSMGNASVIGPGSHWNSSGNLLVGRGGTGELNVEAGGVVSNADAVVGQLSGGTGTATVTGMDSHWNNTGSLVISANGTGELNIEAGGMVSNTDGSISTNANATATVTGADSQWSNSGDLYVGGSVGGAGGTGTLNIQDEGTVSVADMLKVWDDGTVNLESGMLTAQTLDLLVPAAAFNMTGGTLAVESVLGDLTQDGGTLAPGSSPGTTMISGEYILNSGSLDIEIGGLIAGDQHDQLIAAGDVSLAGSLNVVLIGPFELASAQQFAIVEVGGIRSGNFTGLNEGDVVGTFGSHELLISYTGGDGNDVVLIANDPVLLGDVNLDGVVNLLDVEPFIILLSSGTFQAEADINEDGVVNLLDVEPFIVVLSGG